MKVNKTIAVLEVVKYGHPILERKMKEVTDFSILPELTINMFDTMYEEEGIGLAANQIGEDLNLFVVDITHTDEWDEPIIFVNGKIVDKWEKSTMEEGCLSVPGVRVDVQRAEVVRLEYQDINGNKYNKRFEGLMARVIQHEMDHINGILIINKVTRLKLSKYKHQLEEIVSQSQERHYSGD